MPEEAVGDPFYIILVNARHEKPLQEAPADEKVDVTVTVKSMSMPSPLLYATTNVSFMLVNVMVFCMEATSVARIVFFLARLILPIDSGAAVEKSLFLVNEPK